MGVDRIAFGTDYPFPLGDLEMGKILEEELPSLNTLERSRLLSGTALEWLGIQEDYFE